MDNFNLIEQYLQEKMSSDEKIAFEERLENEPELMEEKNAIVDLILGVESLALKEKLKGRKIGGSSGAKVVSLNSKSRFPFQKLAIAASITAIFFCGWWFLKPNVSFEDQLFSQAFSIDPGLPTPMSETNNYNFYDAMVEYKMENYEEAIELWKSSKTNIGQDTLNFYIGMAYLNKGDYSQAISELQKVDQTSALSRKSQWYQLSILIKQKNYSEAKKLIKTLPTDIHPKFGEISKYLENIL